MLTFVIYGRACAWVLAIWNSLALSVDICHIWKGLCLGADDMEQLSSLQLKPELCWFLVSNFFCFFFVIVSLIDL